jgi:photosystem II stability/assembly factor-like uncharacterized protein
MIYLATRRGLYRWFEATGTLKFFGLAETPLFDVAVGGDGRVVALDAAGRIWSTRNGGIDWHVAGLSNPSHRPTAILAVPGTDTVLLGTSPPAVYRCHWGGGSWEAVVTLHDQPIAEGWYAPGGGSPAVRTLAVAPDDPEMLYADIHVGGVVRSTDAGRTWQRADEGLEQDVHEVCTSPANPQGVYAATAEGFYFSPDHAASWQRRNEGLDRHYCRAVAVHAENPEIVLVSASPTPPPGWATGGKRFGLYRTEDGGATWELVVHGLHPEANDVIDSGCVAFSREAPGQVLCGYESGELFVSQDSGMMWQPAAQKLARIYRVVAV